MSESDEAIQELETIKDFVRWGYSRFAGSDIYYGHGTDNPLDEAYQIVLHTLNLPHEFNQAYLDARLTRSEKQRICELFDRRIRERIPAAYLTREAWFANLPFYVDERVLIPRSPIAELIEAQFSPWLEPDQVHHVLDMCTGSACIAIACAYAFPDAIVDAVDVSADAIEVADLNVSRHGLEEQVNVIQSNLFENLEGRVYDLIVSNPPYVSSEEMQQLPVEYGHEPSLALEAEDEGLDIVVQMLRQAPEYLTAHGVMIIEVGNSQYALAERYPDVPFLWLDFERGGEGVFLLTAQQVREYHDRF